ncbi:MAG: hypothetical protein ACREFL_12685, partial [Stellaceae bacterium]
PDERWRLGAADRAAMNDPLRIRTTSYPAAQASPEPILVMFLPGFDMRAEDFARHGFIDWTRHDFPAADILIAEPDLDLYLEGTVGTQLAALLRSVATGHQRVWLAGISLGCFGALVLAEGPIPVEGIVLLAPFLGTAGLIAEVHRPGGLQAWEPGEFTEDDHERRLLARLKPYGRQLERWPTLWLGYGRSDRFAAASRLLAELLPPSRIFEIEGAHDWPSWTRLRDRILAAGAFARANSACG